MRDKLVSIVEHRSKILINPDSITGLSFYHTASRIATAFKDRRIFLIGDAAHLFFPAGGYGMNVALEDSFTLGWRLACTEAGVSPSSVFDSFASERRANALEIQADATQKKAALERSALKPEDEKEEQIYGHPSSFADVISERVEKIIPITLSQNIRQGELSLFDYINSHHGFSLIAYTSSLTVLTQLKTKCAVLNGRSPIPFSLVHVCLGNCLFPKETASCFTTKDSRSVEFFQRHPESVMSIRPDNFVSIIHVQAASGHIDPFITPVPFERMD